MKSLLRGCRGSLLCLIGGALFIPFSSAEDATAAKRHAVDPEQEIIDLAEAGRYREALVLAEKFLVQMEREFGRESIEAAVTLGFLVMVSQSAGEQTKAVSFAERALKASTVALGAEHADTVRLLEFLAKAYVEEEDYAKAEPLLRRLLVHHEKTLGPEDRDTYLALNELALTCQNLRRFDEAETLLRRALKVAQKIFGPGDNMTAKALDNLAVALRLSGDMEEAKALHLQALPIHEEAAGAQSRDVAACLDDLASLYVAVGNLEDAEKCFGRATKIYERDPESDDRSRAVRLNKVALAYNEVGAHRRAEHTFEQALAIKRKAAKEDPVELAIGLDNLGMLEQEMGNFSKAEACLTEALAIFEDTTGPKSEDTATCLHNFGLLRQAIGDYDAAEKLFLRALEIKRHLPDRGDGALGNTLNALGVAYAQHGKVEKAINCYREAAGLFEKQFGVSHPDTALTRFNLGQLVGDAYPKEGIRLIESAIAAWKLAGMAAHPRTSVAYAMLAGFYDVSGDTKRAESLYERAIEECGTTLGPEHPWTTICLDQAGRSRVRRGDAAGACEYARLANAGKLAKLAILLSFTSEQQRLQFQEAVDWTSTPATVGNAAMLAEIVLRTKGVVLDSLMEDRLIARSSSDPALVQRIERLRELKRNLLRLSLSIDVRGTAAASQREELAEKVSTEESALAREISGLGVARQALRVTAADVRRALSRDTALIEMVRYGHQIEKGRVEPRYGAIILAQAAEPSWVPLGTAESLDSAVALYGRSVRGAADEATFDKAIRRLNEMLWGPIERALPPGTRHLVFSPDGALNTVSFATLVAADGSFVAERFDVSYVSSGRDLLRKSQTIPRRDLTIFADADFGDTSGKNARLAATVRDPRLSRELRNFGNQQLSRLPGTETEARLLAGRAEEAGWRATVFKGAAATEKALAGAAAPGVLHVATHGFFIEDPEAKPSRPSAEFAEPGEIADRAIPDPMWRSGLAFTGAQHAFDAWSRGEAPPVENDGIVTAGEVSALDLAGTWLVTLSACDTGSGEVRSGEGVLGLRRGFIQAGAQNLLMTLWPISDATTVHIMLDFYDRAFRAGNAPQALAETQRDWLVKLRKERGLLEAVRLAGPFIMSSQGTN